MDLAICPSCGESVLDDDAKDCPFCGESMSAKPKPKQAAAKPAAQQSTTTAKEKTKQTGIGTTTKTAAAKSKPKPKKTSDDDQDDPFDFDPSVAQRAHPLARKPAKGKMHRIVCPMCDTAGFSSKKAAGCDVKCANADCMVPVFTAPRIETRKEEPDPSLTQAKQSSSAGLIIGICVILLAAVGGVVFYIYFYNPSSDSQTDKLPFVAPIIKNNDNTKTPEEKDPTTKQAVAVKTTDLSKIRKSALLAMVKAAQTRDKRNRKPFSRRQTAETFASIGDVVRYKVEMQQLDKVRENRMEWFRIPPSVALAWHQLENEPTELESTLNQALVDIDNLPQIGNFPVEACTKLAAVLVAAGRSDDAKKLMKRHRYAPAAREFSFLIDSTMILKEFDFKALVARQPLLKLSEPEWVVVTLRLLAHGYRDEALQWALSASGEQALAECLSAWADVVTRDSVLNSKPQLVTEIEVLANMQRPPIRSSMLARVAATQLRLGDNEGCLKSLEKAQTALNLVAVGNELVLPDKIEVLYDLKVSDPTLKRIAAAAAEEIARVQDRLKKPTEAWSSIQLALKLCRSTAPNPTAIDQRVNEIAENRGEVRRQLMVAFKLDKDTDARQFLNNYRQNCRRLQTIAQARFTLETELLRRAIVWNLLDPVAKEIQARSDEELDHNQREPFSSTPLPMMLANRYSKLRMKDKAQEMKELADPEPVQSTRNAITRDQLTRHYLDPAFAVAYAKKVKTSQFQRSTPEETEWFSALIIRLSCQLIRSGEVKGAIDLVLKNPNDRLWKERALRIVAALAITSDLADEAWKITQNHQRLSPTERVVLNRGFVEAIDAVSIQDSQTSEAATTTE